MWFGPSEFLMAWFALGFSVLAFSDFTFIRQLGILTAGLMVLCLLADLRLLPALLLRLRTPPEGVEARS
jgi:predicted RND superfamily exporter protein